MEKKAQEVELDTDKVIELGESIGIDWSTVSFGPEELLQGIDVEALEHGPSNPETDVTGGDLAIAAKIAWAHLSESSEYYGLLEEMEKEF